MSLSFLLHNLNLVSQIEELHDLAAHRRHLKSRDKLCRFELDIRRNSHLRAEDIFYLLYERLRVVVATDTNLNLIRSQRVCKDLDDIVLNIRNIIQDIIQNWWVDSCTLELNHLSLSTYNRA